MATKNLPEADNTAYGIVSIMCGIMSWTVLGIVFAPMSIVIGIIGVSKNKVLSAIGLCLGLISLIFLIIGFATFTTLQTRLK